MAKILVIDDYNEICESLKEILLQDGHEVLTSNSGDEGLRICELQKPGLVIADVMMAEMSGVEMLKKLRNSGNDVEVILMTGHATVETAVEGLKEGAYDYILKPINFSALRYDIQRVLEKRDISAQLTLQQVKMVQLAKMTAVGQLGAGVAHEMNQPLMAMSAYLESLLMDPVTSAQPAFKKKILKIKDQFTRLGTIVKRMHDYSGSRTAGFVHEDVNRPIHDGYYILRQQLKDHNILIHEQLADGLPKVSMDRYQIQDIVINFLVNASDAIDDRFGRNEGGEMTLLSQQLKCSEAVFVGFIDNGIPVKTGTELNIFEPFFTTKHPGKGTGLGLSVSQGIIKNHRGLISFASLPGERKIFYFVIPLNAERNLSEADPVLAQDIKQLLSTL